MHPTDDPTAVLLRLCRAELVQVQAALETARESQADDRERREDAERRLQQLSEAALAHLRSSPRPGLAGRLLARGSDSSRVDLVRGSALFDGAWYLRTYPHVLASGLAPEEHYVRVGADEGLDPGPRFSTTDYLRGHPEVAESGDNPLVHHLTAT